jgi:hypothetical protein
MPIFPTLRRLRQDDCKFKTNLSFIARNQGMGMYLSGKHLPSMPRVFGSITSSVKNNSKCSYSWVPFVDGHHWSGYSEIWVLSWGLTYVWPSRCQYTGKKLTTTAWKGHTSFSAYNPLARRSRVIPLRCTEECPGWKHLPNPNSAYKLVVLRMVGISATTCPSGH